MLKKQSKTVSDQHMSPRKVVDIRKKYIIQLQQMMPITEEVTLTDCGYGEHKHIILTRFQLQSHKVL